MVCIVFIAIGQDGLVYVNKEKDKVLHYIPAPLHKLPVVPVSVSGAGDR